MSIIETAKLAGVSTATVSRVVNYSPNVSEECIRRVRRAMKHLGYNPVGKNKMPAFLNCVGLLVVSNHMFDPFSSVGHLLIKGASEALRKKGVDMILSYVSEPDNLPDYVVHRKVQGLIVMGHNPNKQLVDKLSDIPVVWMTSHNTNKGDVVLAGNEQIGKIAAEYLIARGHQSIAVLNTLTEAAGETRAKFFRFIAKDSGVKVSVFYPEKPSAKIWDNDIDLEWFENEVAQQVERMLGSENRPTGLFIPSDFQTAMVYRILQKKGIRPGFDIDIISTDDEKGALMGLYPRPATINIGAKSMGECAVEYLLMQGSPLEKSRVQISIKPQLIAGENTNTNWSSANHKN